MAESPGHGSVRAAVRLAAVLVLLVAALVMSFSPSPRAWANGCFGDEQILLAPEEPHVGGVLIVAAVSRHPHDQVLLLGPLGPIDATRTPIGDRFVWQGTIVPQEPGELVFAMMVAAGDLPLVPCAEAVVAVAGTTDGLPVDVSDPAGATAEASALFASLHPWAAGGSPVAASGLPAASVGDGTTAAAQEDAAALVSRTPRPTSTPRPPRASSADNGNENDNEADPTPTKTRTPTRTPTLTRTPRPTGTPRPAATDTPAPTPTLAPPTIADPGEVPAQRGQAFTIRGQRFGSSQKAVDGVVILDGREAEVLSWSMTEIEFRVPQTARTGQSRVLQVIVAGNTATILIRVNG